MTNQDDTIDRTAIFAQNFIKRVNAKDFPAPISNTSLEQAQLSKELALEIFTSQIDCG